MTVSNLSAMGELGTIRVDAGEAPDRQARRVTFNGMMAGWLMPTNPDSRQQPKSLAHKMLEAHLAKDKIELDVYCNFCDNKFTDDEQLHCAACGRHR